MQRNYFGGNPNLKASESKGKTFGVVVDVPGIKGLSVTATEPGGVGLLLVNSPILPEPNLTFNGLTPSAPGVCGQRPKMHPFPSPRIAGCR